MGGRVTAAQDIGVPHLASWGTGLDHNGASRSHVKDMERTAVGGRSEETRAVGREGE